VWHIHVWDMTLLCVEWLYIRDITHPYTFLYMCDIFYMCEVTLLCAEWLTYVTLLIQFTWGKNSHVWHDTFMRRMTYTREITHPYTGFYSYVIVCVIFGQTYEWAMSCHKCEWVISVILHIRMSYFSHSAREKNMSQTWMSPVTHTKE